MYVGTPPFLGHEWRYLAPDLLKEVQTVLDDVRHQDGSPCIWLDLTSLRCMHYEDRPDVCRDFELGGKWCVQHREELGLSPK